MAGSELSASGWQGLQLDEAERLALASAGISHWKQLRDLTLPRLQARTHLSAAAAEAVLLELDRWCHARFRGDLILPSLSAPCQEIELDYLPLADSTLATLARHGIEYVYQLALSRRSRLEVWLGTAATAAAIQVLEAWFADWRSGELVLYEENEL